MTKPTKHWQITMNITDTPEDDEEYLTAEDIKKHMFVNLPAGLEFEETGSVQDIIVTEKS